MSETNYIEERLLARIDELEQSNRDLEGIISSHNDLQDLFDEAEDAITVFEATIEKLTDERDEWKAEAEKWEEERDEYHSSLDEIRDMVNSTI